MTSNDLLQRIREGDPLDPAEVESWYARARPRLGDLTSARDAPRARRRRAPVVVVAALSAALGGAGVAVATGLLGGPAPDAVKEHLAELDGGIPADLRYDPDLDNARAVAATENGALYLADLAAGGYCIEIGSPTSQPRGASCVRASDLSNRPLDVLAPLPGDDQAALLVGGRANSSRITAVVIRYADSSTSSVALGLDGGWLAEVPEASRASALAKGLTVLGVDGSGATMAAVRVPALRDDDPLSTAHDADEPLVLTTTSDGDDLTLVLGVQGRVNLPGAVRLEVRFPDGSRLAVPVRSDGSYAVVFAAERRDDFARSLGTLVALRDGKVLASRPVGSVAAWRERNG